MTIVVKVIVNNYKNEFSQKNKNYKMGLGVCVCVFVCARARACVCICVSVRVKYWFPPNNLNTNKPIDMNFVYLLPIPKLSNARNPVS